VPEFPKKRLLNNMSDDVVKERKIALDQFLQQMTGLDGIQQLDALHEFVRREAMSKDHKHPSSMLKKVKQIM